MPGPHNDASAADGESAMYYGALMEIIRETRSIRRFRPDPVPDELIEKTTDAARWARPGSASSSGSDRPCRFSGSRPTHFQPADSHPQPSTLPACIHLRRSVHLARATAVELTLHTIPLSALRAPEASPYLAGDQDCLFRVCPDEHRQGRRPPRSSPRVLHAIHLNCACAPVRWLKCCS